MNIYVNVLKMDSELDADGDHAKVVISQGQIV